ncbi:hypothetical protein Agabi119p4_9624 [Agaricus bisporus var. burnettii]|uniref:DUF6533 domain-containing protein n=1 Tax=Agaricus bisporus var. burnettii TaxID=192524 RepID=A0A8H7C3K0_AGABI|nr:hypothetical protein Agabi119p4_9624 [Agaricus bisporus var. burnettii]
MDLPDPVSATLRLLAGKYLQIASFIMLAYDHMITFGQEVEVIWKRPMSFATILFFLNRYANLMQCIVLVVAFHEPDWRGEPYVPSTQNDSRIVS